MSFSILCSLYFMNNVNAKIVKKCDSGMLRQ